MSSSSDRRTDRRHHLFLSSSDRRTDAIEKISGSLDNPDKGCDVKTPSTGHRPRHHVSRARDAWRRGRCTHLFSAHENTQASTIIADIAHSKTYNMQKYMQKYVGVGPTNGTTHSSISFVVRRRTHALLYFFRRWTDARTDRRTTPLLLSPSSDRRTGVKISGSLDHPNKGCDVKTGPREGTPSTSPRVSSEQSRRVATRTMS